MASANATVPWATLRSSLSIFGENFGRAVAISSTRAIVSAPGGDFFSGPIEGRAYVFDLTGPPPTLPITALSNPGFSNVFGGSVAISGNRVVEWGSSDDTPRKAAVLIVLLSRPGTTYDVSSPDLATVS